MSSSARIAVPALVCALLLGGAARAETTIIVLDVKTDVTGVPRSTLQSYTDIVAAHLAGAEGVRPITSADIAAVLDLESQSRDILGCEDGFCLADFAGALGSELVIFGRYGVSDGLHTLQVRLVEIETSKAVAIRTLTAAAPDEFVLQLPDAVDELLVELLGPGAAGATQRAAYDHSKDVGRVFFASLLTGGAAAIGGVLGTVVAVSTPLDPLAQSGLVILTATFGVALTTSLVSPVFTDWTGFAWTVGAGSACALGLSTIAFIVGVGAESTALVAGIAATGGAAACAAVAGKRTVLPADDSIYFGE